MEKYMSSKNFVSENDGNLHLKCPSSISSFSKWSCWELP